MMDKQLQPGPAKWPLLLQGIDKLNVKTERFTPLPHGCNPVNRPILEYIQYGCINLDKPANPSSHEIVSWIKRLLQKGFPQVEKTGHSGTLDPPVTGNLINATRLVKAQQGAGKEYVCIIRFHGDCDEQKFLDAVKFFTGPVYQKPPLQSAVKKRLRVRSIYWNKVIQFDAKRRVGVFHVSCEAGTYIRTLCIHIGMYLGCGAHMQELRRVRSGCLNEKDNMVTMHDLLDAVHMYSKYGDESVIRKVIMPLERLMLHYPKLIVKDSSVASVCYGSKLHLPGLLRYSNGIEPGKEVVMMTTKGEAIALGVAIMSTSEMMMCDHGIVAKVKRCIMQRDRYPRKWGMGPVAKLKAQFKKEGKLSPHLGNILSTTPESWKKFAKEYYGNENLKANAKLPGEQKKESKPPISLKKEKKEEKVEEEETSSEEEDSSEEEESSENEEQDKGSEEEEDQEDSSEEETSSSSSDEGEKASLLEKRKSKSSKGTKKSAKKKKKK